MKGTPLMWFPCRGEHHQDRGASGVPCGPGRCSVKGLMPLAAPAPPGTESPSASLSGRCGGWWPPDLAVNRVPREKAHAAAAVGALLVWGGGLVWKAAACVQGPRPPPLGPEPARLPSAAASPAPVTLRRAFQSPLSKADFLDPTAPACVPTSVSSRDSQACLLPPTAPVCQPVGAQPEAARRGSPFCPHPQPQPHTGSLPDTR